MGRPPGQGPARDYRVREPETSPRARARGSLLRNGHGDLPPAGGTRRSDVFPTISRRTPGLPAASPFRGAAAPAFPLILRTAHRDGGYDNSRVSLLHAPGGGRGLRDTYARVLVRRHVAWKLVQCLRAREASSPGSLKPGMGGS